MHKDSSINLCKGLYSSVPVALVAYRAKSKAGLNIKAVLNNNSKYKLYTALATEL